jgi:regulator of sigma E protease
MGVRRDGKMIEIAIPNDFLKTYQAEGGGPVFMMDMAPRLQIVDSIMDTTSMRFEATPAKAAGIMDGDLVTKVDSVPVRLFSQLRAEISKHKNTPVQLTLMRKGVEMNVMVTPNDKGKIYASPKLDSTLEKHVTYSFGEALVAGPKLGVKSLVRQAKFLASMASGNASARKNMGGMIKIATTLKQGVDQGGLQAFWGITAMISMGLAFMNLLPIPALDGGHVVFLLIEMIIRRDINEKFKMRAIQVGFFLVIGLIVLLLFKDTLEVFFGIS